MTHNIEFGRVLRSSTAGFSVGCRVTELDKPAFGCLVKAQPIDEREAIYGLIYDMHIDDDPLVRRLVLAESPRPSAIEDQRHNRLLPIEMSILAIGYRLNDRIHYGMPPRPPPQSRPGRTLSRSSRSTRLHRPEELPAPHLAQRRQQRAR